ncbi:hypothetical protein [Microbulbifer aggregans]|uniref:hypothetical protein n=1 Tax=Microbulbifer aggregans TaxID=1769779 RepID=UPI001CFE9A2D|nr:hypothetical protein [Microbulbifer aggregans]
MDVDIDLDCKKDGHDKPGHDKPGHGKPGHDDDRDSDYSYDFSYHGFDIDIDVDIDKVKSSDPCDKSCEVNIYVDVDIDISCDPGPKSDCDPGKPGDDYDHGGYAMAGLNLGGSGSEGMSTGIAGLESDGLEFSDPAVSSAATHFEALPAFEEILEAQVEAALYDMLEETIELADLLGPDDHCGCDGPSDFGVPGANLEGGETTMVSLEELLDDYFSDDPLSGLGLSQALDEQFGDLQDPVAGMEVLPQDMEDPTRDLWSQSGTHDV